MKHAAWLAVALTVPALTGCGRESHDSLRKQQTQTVTEAAAALAAATDSATVEAARPKLKTVSERWRDVEKRQGALPVPTPEQAAELQRKYEAELTAARQRFADEAVRVAALPGGKQTLDEVGDIAKLCAFDAHEVVRKQQIQTAKEAADLLEGIKDRAGVEAAKPRVRELMTRWQNLEKSQETLPALSPDQQAELKKRHEDAFNGVAMRFGRERLRVAFVPGAMDALKEFNDIKKK